MPAALAAARLLHRPVMMRLFPSGALSRPFRFLIPIPWPLLRALAERIGLLLALASSACAPTGCDDVLRRRGSSGEREGVAPTGATATAGDEAPRADAAAGRRKAPAMDTTGLAIPGADTISAKTAGADELLVVAAGAPSRGPADAAVVIVEFSDFECPFCSRASETLQRLLDGRPDVRLVYMQFPILSLHPGAMLPAEASLEAHRQAKFWPFHDALFERSKRGASLDREAVLGIAHEQGLDVAAMRKALDRRTHRPRVESEMRVGEGLGINGTPTFFVNGYRLVGAQPYETFVTVYNLLLRASRRAEVAAADPAS